MQSPQLVRPPFAARDVGDIATALPRKRLAQSQTKGSCNARMAIGPGFTLGLEKRRGALAN